MKNIPKPKMFVKVLNFLMILILTYGSVTNAFQSAKPFNDIPFHTNIIYEPDMFEQEQNNSSCQEIWCEIASNPYNNYYDDLDLEYDGTKGFWLEPPPDDIIYIPPPPMPPSLHAYFGSFENDSMREFIIGKDPIEGYRCNFCKMFDPNVYHEDDSKFHPSSMPNRENESFTSWIYLLIISLLVIFLLIIFVVVKYKK